MRMCGIVRASLLAVMCLGEAVAWAQSPTSVPKVSVPKAAVPKAAVTMPAGGWVVLAVRGRVTVDGKIIAAGEKIAAKSTVRTESASLAKFGAAGNAIAVVGPDSELILNAPDEKNVGTVAKGLVRWVFKKQPADRARSAAAVGDAAGEVRYEVRTSNAVMGIRGTEFLTIATPLFGESEIVCFDGTVRFSALGNTGGKDSREVGANQWGGLGGRFGSKIAPLLTLPATVVTTLRSQGLLKTQIAGASAHPDFHGEELPTGF